MQQSFRALRVALFVCIASLTACGSLSKDAKKLMETGNYQDAIGLWDQVIAKDPNDAEARFYLNLAKSQLLNEDLVTLKGLIDSRQTLNAFDHLQKFNKKRNEWNLGLSPNSSLYLKQQTDRLYVRYLDLAQQSLQKGQVLRALWLDRQYRFLLDTQVQEDETKLKQDIQSLGEKKCITLDAESKTLPDLRMYATQFCKKFNRAIPHLTKLDDKINAGLSSVKAIEVDVAPLTRSEKGMLTDEIQYRIDRLAQFSKNGKRPEVLKVSGNFLQENTDRNIPMSHSYQVQIPYLASEVVKHTKSVPYTAAEQRCGSTGCWSESVTKYKDVDEYETVSVTKMRSEPRVYEFTGREFTQKLGMTLELQKITVTSDFTESSNSHNLTLPDIGLYPKSANLTVRETWLEKRFLEFGHRYYEERVKQWIASECAPKTHSAKWAHLDRALHCIRQEEGKTLAWIRQASQDHEGLEPQQVLEIIGPLAD